MTFWQQRRIPITRGWGPCKRTNRVPVSEHYSHQGADGITRDWDWQVGLDPGAFVRRGGMFPPYDDFPYLGFRETRPGGPGWISRGRPGDGRGNRGLNELLDEILARGMQEDEDRRAISERRADEFRARWLRLHDEENACRDNFPKHLQEYDDRTRQPISDDRLTGLRAEAESYEQRRRQREDEQNRRDRDREREILDARLGRRTREELGDYGFMDFRRQGW